MTQLRDCTEPATWWPHIDEAVRALAAGGLVVLPTDTVYGIAADAFSPAAVQSLLDAKGRGRQMPPPVLIGDVRTLDGLADAVPDRVRELVGEHWPGPLTVIVRAQPSLQWDLGETEGTVALRMPDHELTLTVLRKTGPLAVSSANRSGSPAATTAADAAEQLGDAVRVYLDGGDSPGGVASTIVDATGPELRIVREGALTAEQLGIVVAPDEPDADAPDAVPAATTEPVAERSTRRRAPRRATAPAGPPAAAGAATEPADDAPTVAPTEPSGGETPSDADADAGAEAEPEVVLKPVRRRTPRRATAPSSAPAAVAGESGGESPSDAAAEVGVSPTPARRRAPRRATAPAGAAAREPADETAVPADGPGGDETGPGAPAP